MFKLHNGYECYTFSAEFKHPDHSPMFKEVVVECADNEDTMEWDVFCEKVAELIWHEYNDSEFYHTMTLSHVVQWENNKITYLRDYNGVECSNYRVYHKEYKED